MGRNWTEEQLTAINAESGSLLLSAAAGSGKTSVLVERLVRKLTDPVDPVSPDSLVVVTFTNAAAAEMRTRIAARVTALASEEPARRRELSALLARLGEMKISTMDAFCMGFVRENFHACGVEADFRMLDNGEAQVLKYAAADEVVEKLYAEDKESFLPLAELFDRGRSDEVLSNGIIKLSDFSMSEPDPEAWLDGISEHFAVTSPDESVYGELTGKDILEALGYCAGLAEDALRDLSNDETLYGKLGSVLESDLSLIGSLRERFLLLSWDEKADQLVVLLKNIAAKQMRAPKGYTDDPYKIAASEKRDEIKAALKKCVAAMCVTTAENAEDIAVLTPAAEELIKAVKLFNFTLLEKKKEMNAYDFPDILHFTLSQLSDPAADDGKTEKAREMSRSISEILIDEYQDTNRAQEYLFTALSDKGNNMFTVGDVKQSIYRFRLASPELFIEKCAAYPYYDGREKRSKIILGKNFRSRKGVTDAVNFVFSSLMSEECGEIAYGEDERLKCAASYPASDTPDVYLSVLADAELSGIEAEAVYAARLIREMLDRGERVWENGQYRKAVPGDFCILTRASKGVIPVFAAELRKAGLSAAVDSREGFFESAEIRMLLSLLRVIDNPGRDVDLLAVMLSPLFGFTPDDAARVRVNARKNGEKKASLFSAVTLLASQGDPLCAALISKISDYKKLAAIMSAEGLLNEILADTSFLSVCSAMSEGELRKNNVRRLLEYAGGSGAENRRTPGGFIRYMDSLMENGAAVSGAASSADGDSVSVMTMHRSKGLEFPFVIIAGMCRKFNQSDTNSSLLISHRYGIGLKRQVKEELRLFDTLSSSAVKTELHASSMSEELRIYYVAMTRAKEKLFLVMAPDKPVKKLQELGSLLPERHEIPPYLVKNASAPYQWILMSFLRHPDAAALRLTGKYVSSADSPAEISLISSVLPYREEDNAKALAPAADAALLEEIRKKADYVYPYAAVSSALSKHTASSLNEEKFSTEYFGKSVPAFLYGKKASPADIGTATHRFLQYCDFAAFAADPEAERDRLVTTGRLDAFMASLVDTDAVSTFVHSPLMRRVGEAQAVYREKQFTMAKSVCDMDPAIPEEFRTEKTVVIGKIDMIFVENGRAVIVDYKTDNVTDMSVLAKRYSRQLQLYAEAVERSMELPVGECLLYSLNLKRFIRI